MVLRRIGHRHQSELTSSQQHRYFVDLFGGDGVVFVNNGNDMIGD